MSVLAYRVRPMRYESRKTIGAYEVRPGLRMPFHTNSSDVGFGVTVVCDQSHPTELWHGEVSIAGKVLFETEQFDTHHKAGRAAIDALAEKFIRLMAE
jgi:hypothetical protein